MPAVTNDWASEGMTVRALSSPSSVRKEMRSRPGPGRTDATCLPPGTDVTITRSPVISRTVAEASRSAIGEGPSGGVPAEAVVTPPTVTISTVDIAADRRIHLIRQTPFERVVVR